MKYQLGTLEPPQHFLGDLGESKKTCVRMAVRTHLCSVQDSIAAYRKGIFTGSWRERKNERKKEN
jgi:hypothetical protein